MKDKTEYIYPNELEAASNSYLMAVIGLMVGLPLPIVNVIAALIFYSAKRKASYFVRWHSTQAVLAQVVLLPFNSFALAWTISIFFCNVFPTGIFNHLPQRYYTVTNIPYDSITSAGLYYWLYIAFIVLLNIFEFIAVMTTASRVRKGENVRWFVIAGITDVLCSKENRDPYRI